MMGVLLSYLPASAGQLSETEGASEDPCSMINGDRSLLRECRIKNVPEGTLFIFYSIRFCG